jgi:GNAT superfamily N-acetyltransferase
MRDGFVVSVIEGADEEILGAVEELFRALYDSMYRVGLMIPLAPDGVRKWRDAVSASLGRFGVIVVARRASGDERIIGFAQGVLRRTPDYLGSLWIGHVSHVYVAEEFRSTGCGSRMVDALLEWFARSGVRSVELQVLVRNTQGIRFWEREGFTSELVQMRRSLPS